MRVNLSQVVYVRTENAEHRVGFGLGLAPARAVAPTR